MPCFDDPIYSDASPPARWGFVLELLRKVTRWVAHHTWHLSEQQIDGLVEKFREFLEHAVEEERQRQLIN